MFLSSPPNLVKRERTTVKNEYQEAGCWLLALPTVPIAIGISEGGLLVIGPQP